MRTIDMQTWSRRQHFELFSTYTYPHFGLSANVDLTAFYPAVKQRGYSLTVAIVYLLARASNAIPEFRYRIRDGEVMESANSIRKCKAICSNQRLHWARRKRAAQQGCTRPGYRRAYELCRATRTRRGS